MYSNKENVNILTSLLVAHGVHHAVCCPGSRNSPIVHNLNACPDIACYPVTDERSAGFYALGMSQCLQEPVVVCVTSGTALLNLAPAVAEACYQHIPLVVISADRPQAWIDQLDGQTLPQPDAFGRFVKKSVSLPEPHDDETRWYCNRLVNEALIGAWLRKPVLINVPISEPLFNYENKELQEQRMICYDEPSNIFADIVENGLAEDFCHARKPMIVIGQYGMIDDELIRVIDKLKEHVVVLYESLSHPQGGIAFDEVLQRIDDDERYLPDFLLYCGDSIVSKRLKKFLRKGVDCVWEVTEDGEIHDTFMCVDAVIDGCAWTVLSNLSEILSHEPFIDEYKGTDFTCQDTTEYTRLWRAAIMLQEDKRCSYIPSFSQMATVKYFENNFKDGIAHYANSSSIRLANIYARHYVYCNRGVNGIEGSLSTAAGFSCVFDQTVFCVIGDLSFFYDQNALWNQNLRGNFRILLLNNGKGGIFNMLKGLEQSPARDKFVAAEHHTSAEGICRQNGVAYMKATNMEEMQKGIDTLLNTESDCPMLLEVFTDAAEDERVFKDYYKSLKI